MKCLHKEVADAVVNKISLSSIFNINIEVEHCKYTSYITINIPNFHHTEYLYIDTTNTGNIQMRRKLPCDGFRCYSTTNTNTDDEIALDFISKYLEDLAKTLLKKKQEVELFECLIKGFKNAN